jgi:hypothetical protein
MPSNPISEDDFDLPVVNRGALVLRATQAFIEWANSCGEGPKLALEEMNEDEHTVYLVPEVEYRPDAWLRQHFRILFEYELASWCTDAACWPEDRSFEAFQRYFTVQFHSMVVDLGDEPITSGDE